MLHLFSLTHSLVTLQLSVHVCGLAEFIFHLTRLNPDMFQIAYNTRRLSQTFFNFDINAQGINYWVCWCPNSSHNHHVPMIVIRYRISSKSCHGEILFLGPVRCSGAAYTKIYMYARMWLQWINHLYALIMWVHIHTLLSTLTTWRGRYLLELMSWLKHAVTF